MPVGVIGANFSKEYEIIQMEAKRKEKLRQQRLDKDARRRTSVKSADEKPVPLLKRKRSGDLSHQEMIDMEIADELRQVLAIIDRAMAMDAELTNMLKENGVLHRLRKDLKEFMQDLLNSRNKAGS